MGESDNISKIATKVANELLLPVGWRMFGGVNFNFPCVEEEKNRKSAKHPCDVVFGYDDPYQPKTVYFLTDLKSYNRETLKDKAKLRKAIENLAKSVSCGWKSPTFQRNFPTGTWELHGLLFVYNHDGLFDRDFYEHIFEAKKRDLNLPIRSRLFVIGSEDIQFYYDVLNDLERELGKANIQNNLHFFYPNQIERIPTLNFYPSATIELLKSPFITVCSKQNASVERKAWLYYRGAGETPKEFEYLLDYCFRYSLVEDASSLEIRMPYPAADYQNNFAVAQNNFIQHFYNADAAFTKVQQIKVARVTETRVIYTEYEIGMEARAEFSK
jgi:hypothetical protein